MTTAERAAFIREAGRGLKDARARERIDAAAQLCIRARTHEEAAAARAAVDDSLWAVEGWGTLADRRALWAVLAVLDGDYEAARTWLGQAREVRARTEERGR